MVLWLTIRGRDVNAWQSHQSALKKTKTPKDFKNQRKRRQKLNKFRLGWSFGWPYAREMWTHESHITVHPLVRSPLVTIPNYQVIQCYYTTLGSVQYNLWNASTLFLRNSTLILPLLQPFIFPTNSIYDRQTVSVVQFFVQLVYVKICIDNVAGCPMDKFPITLRRRQS